MLSRFHLRNEWRVLARHPLLWISFAGLAAFSMLFANGSPAEPGSDAAAALLRLNLFIPSFMLPFMAGALGPILYLREVDHGMAEMFGSYPVSLKEWLTTRCGTLTILLVSGCLVAQLIFLMELAPEHIADLPKLAAHTILWFLILHLPSSLLWACALAWLACRKGNAGFLYLAAGLGWLGYLGVATLTGTPLISGSATVWPSLKHAMFILDPYAATAMLNPMPESGLLQWRWLNVGLGRIFWVGASLLLLVSVRGLPTSPGHRTGEQRTEIGGTAVSNIGIKLLGHAGFHLVYFARDRIFPMLVLGWLALLLPEVMGGMDYAEPLSKIVPDSRDALNRVVWDVLPFAGALLMLYAADRICRLYSSARMHELYGVTQHTAWKLVAVQLASLSIVAIFFTVLAGAVVLFAQIMANSQVQPSEYLVQLALVVSRLLLFAAVFVAWHGLLRHRLLANLVCLITVVLCLTNLAPAIGLYHPLWKPLSTPLTAPDHLWGFAGGIEGHFSYFLVWIWAVAGLLLMAVAAGNRTLPAPQVRWMSVAKQPVAIGAVIAFGIAVGQGVAIDLALRKDNALIMPDDRVRKRADYERNYEHWARIVQPEVAAIRTRIDFYPTQYSADIHAIVRLENRSTQAIGKILIGKGPMGENAKVRLFRASNQQRDLRLGQTVFELANAMAPGESLYLSVDLSIAQSALEPATWPLALRPEFSSLPVHAMLPVIGFKREFTIRNPAIRAEHRLPKLKLALPSQTSLPRPRSLVGENVILESIVSTTMGQNIIAQGELVRQWQQGGRALFQYRTAKPIRSLPAYFSVPWQPQVFSAGQYALEVYNPVRLAADDPNILALRDTLEWLDRSVAPYPGTDLRLLAVPDAGPSGYALPQIIQISHRLGFRTKPRSGSGFDQRYRRAAHETAHQWFGHLLGYGLIEERAFLIESLAKYAELVMIERRYGKKAMLALVAFERDRYRHARLDPAESKASLIDAEESEDMYSRATLAFACLRSRVGDAPILSALRAVADDSRLNRRPARSIDFVNALKSKSPPLKADAIDQLFLSAAPIQRVERNLGCDNTA